MITIRQHTQTRYTEVPQHSFLHNSKTRKYCSKSTCYEFKPVWCHTIIVVNTIHTRIKQVLNKLYSFHLKCKRGEIENSVHNTRPSNLTIHFQCIILNILLNLVKVYLKFILSLNCDSFKLWRFCPTCKFTTCIFNKPIATPKRESYCSSYHFYLLINQY